MGNKTVVIGLTGPNLRLHRPLGEADKTGRHHGNAVKVERKQRSATAGMNGRIQPVLELLLRLRLCPGYPRLRTS